MIELFTNIKDVISPQHVVKRNLRRLFIISITLTSPTTKAEKTENPKRTCEELTISRKQRRSRRAKQDSTQNQAKKKTPKIRKER